MLMQPDGVGALKLALEERTALVAVIGLGYVGLPFAAAVAHEGYPVIGVDTDRAKVAMLAAGRSYLGTVPDKTVAALNAAGGTEWTADHARLAEAEVIVICVPTPLTDQGAPDLRHVVETATAVARHMTPATLVVLQSTTYPGTTRDVLGPILASGGAVEGRDYWVAFSPEREDPGNTCFTTATIPKVVGADTPEARTLATTFLERIVRQVVPVATSATAEAVKITENVFRAVNIALVNELKVVYEAMGIDIWEVIDAAASKPFGYMPFYPGPGLGGHCIPIDPFYLSWKARQHDLPTRLIELAGEINLRMPDYVVGRLREALAIGAGQGLEGRRILLLGVAYKKNVSDLRESPALRLMELLLEAGAEVDFHDPHVAEIPPMRHFPALRGRRSVPPGAVRAGGYDGLVIVADHDALDYEALVGLDVPIVDTRNAMARRGLPMARVSRA